MAWVLRSFSILTLCVSLFLTPHLSATPITATSPTINLGDIPFRPILPNLPFKHFFDIQPLSAISFSPDNHSLYFIRNDGEVDNVFAIDLATRKMQQVTHYREPVQALMVSRNGHNLLVVQDQGGNEHYDIFRFNLATEKTDQLTHSAKDDMSYLCDQSPDGNLIYYGQSQDTRSSADLWRLNLETGEKEIVLAAQGRLLECGPVSKDGRYLVFYEYIENNERYIGLVDLEKNLQRYIFRQPQVNNISAAFANGKLYFMNAYRSNYFYLWQYDLQSGTLTSGAAPTLYPLQSFALPADGKAAVFWYRDGLKTRTAFFTNSQTNHEKYHLPKSALIDVVVSETDPGKAVFITSDATTPEKYYLSDQSGISFLYDANQTGISPEQFSEARSLIIPGFDGLGIPTHLFIPNGTSAKAPKPALIWIHGGPEKYIDPEFSSYFQFLTNHGFIVVTPNVRGSSGFGKRYAMLDDGDWGGGHIRDAIAVTQFVKALPFVDEENVFTFGESFGGYSVLSAITQFPKVYRGAVVFSGISELKSFLENLPRYADKYLLSQMGFDPRKDAWRNYLASPYYHIENVAIPIQIHQGINDFRVKKKQTDKLVSKMRSLGREVEYYLYDEGHGLQKFSNEALAYTRLMAFLKRYSAKSYEQNQVTQPTH